MFLILSISLTAMGNEAINSGSFGEEDSSQSITIPARGQRVPQRSVIYVDATATGANNGTSWDDAYTDLVPTIEAATSGDHIWVAAATYKPLVDTDTTYFYLKNGVEIYGGFAGTESTLDERDIEANPTILSGDMNDDDIAGDFETNRDDNTLHVGIVDETIDNSAILDGFTIKGGHTETWVSGEGSDIYRGGGILSYGSPIIKNCTFTDNYATYAGGLYFRDTTSSNGIAENCKFIANYGWAGGSCYVYDSHGVQFIDCEFNDNLAVVEGAGIDCRDSDVNFNNCSFDNNQAATSDPLTSGGAIRCYSISTDVEYLINIENCTISNNSGANHGGGIAAYGKMMVNISNSTFTGNESGDFGGAVHIAGSIDTGLSANSNISNCQFYDNSAINAGSNGGAILTALGESVIDSCYFSGNESGFGGAIIFNAFIDGSTIEPILTNCTFEENNAIQDGGAIYIGNYGANAWVENCTFTNNSGGNGGAILTYGSSNPTIKNCIFQGNQASLNGGAITSSYLNFSHVPAASVINCLFYDNSCALSGGAVALAVDFGAVINCTFSGNSATQSGGAIGAQGSGGSVINCIAWGNSAYVGPEIAELESQGFSVTYSLVEGGYAGSGNIDSDPLFVNPDENDYQLQEGSPAIDAGMSGEIIPDEDLLGNPRDDNPDMGAYEWLSPSGVGDDYTNLVPKKASLLQNFPNPFNPVTTIQFDVPDATRRAVSLQIFDAAGKLVKTLVDSPLASGSYSVVWNGDDNSGKAVASGTYFCKMVTEKYSETRQLVLLK
jgi:predicted outer membrane repeat protein